MLTSQEIRQYEENGYVIPNFRLDENALEAIRAAHTKLATKQPCFSDYCPAALTFDTSFPNIARRSEILDATAPRPNRSSWPRRGMTLR